MPAEQSAKVTIRKPRRIEISPIDISITNRTEVTAGFAYVYLSDDPELGKFEITIKATDNTLGLTRDSVLELYIPADLQTAEQLKRVRLSSESAASLNLEQITDGLRITLKSSASLQVTKDLPVKIGLEGILASGEAEIKRNLTFSWVGFQGVDDDYRLFTMRSILLRKIQANIDCTWLQREEYFEGGGAFVYYTPYEPTTQLPGIRNRLILSLENKGDALTGERAEFTVIFPTEEYGDTRSALCYTEQLKEVGCTRYGPGRAWRIIRVQDGEVTYWRILPPLGDKLVLGSKETVTFEFTNLVTQLKGGEARAQVHWSSLEKLSSGYASTFILKREPTPYLRELYVLDATGRKLGANEGLYCGETYKLCWDTFAADRCEIESTPEGKFTARSFFDFKADQETKRFKVSPQILDKDGRSRTFSGALRPAEAALTKKTVKDGNLDCVLLEWVTRGGVPSLGSIKTSRSRREPNGGEIVHANDVYTLQVDTLGRITERRMSISVPHCFVETRLDWETGPFVTLHWTGSNATRAELTLMRIASRKFSVERFVVAPSSSYRFDVNEFKIAMLQLSGRHGTCIWLWTNGYPANRAPLPTVSLRESVEEQTGKLRVVWNVSSPTAAFLYTDGNTERSETTRTSMDFTRDFVSPVSGYGLLTTNPMREGLFVTLTLYSTLEDYPRLAGKSPDERLQELLTMSGALSALEGQLP